MLTLVVEAVKLVDLRGLVVAPQQEEVLGVLDLVGQQQHDGLDRLLPAVHIVPQEQVILLGREAPVVEDLQQVLELPVDISHDLKRCLELQEDGLFEEHLPRHVADGLHLGLAHLHVLSVLLRHQPGDYRVQLNGSQRLVVHRSISGYVYFKVSSKCINHRPFIGGSKNTHNDDSMMVT